MNERLMRFGLVLYWSWWMLAGALGVWTLIGVQLERMVPHTAWWLMALGIVLAGGAGIPLSKLMVWWAWRQEARYRQRAEMLAQRIGADLWWGVQANWPSPEQLERLWQARKGGDDGEQ